MINASYQRGSELLAVTGDDGGGRDAASVRLGSTPAR